MSLPKGFLPEPVDEKLARVNFVRDTEPHITLKEDICERCEIDRLCVVICPAGNFQLDEKAQRVVVSAESCMECGACRIICRQGAVNWRWPRGGFGVSYLQG